MQSMIGKSAMNSLFPNDFELYLIALELVDSKGNTDEYLVFPVMPTQIQKTENNRVNVKKSSTGTTVLFSQSFTPNDISIKGNFGKSFKFITIPHDKLDSGFIYGVSKNSGLSFQTPNFDATVKTGYGVTKILQRICNKSSKLDTWSKPYRLFFYNMALSESYLAIVPSGGLTLSQGYETNTIWNYNLNLTVLANIEDVKSFSDIKKSSTTLLKSSTIQSGVNLLTSEVKSIL